MISRMHGCLCALSFKFTFKAVSISKSLFRRVSGSDENVYLLQLGSSTASFFLFFLLFAQCCFRIANLDFTSRAFAIHTRRRVEISNRGKMEDSKNLISSRSLIIIPNIRRLRCCWAPHYQSCLAPGTGLVFHHYTFVH